MASKYYVLSRHSNANDTLWSGGYPFVNAAMTALVEQMSVARGNKIDADFAIVEVDEEDSDLIAAQLFHKDGWLPPSGMKIHGWWNCLTIQVIGVVIPTWEDAIGWPLEHTLSLGYMGWTVQINGGESALCLNDAQAEEFIKKFQELRAREQGEPVK